MRKKFLVFGILTAIFSSAEIRILPLADGNSYAQISDDGKNIVAFSYKTGAVRDTIFSLSAVKSSAVERIDSFALDSLERRVLLFSGGENFVYNGVRRTFEKLSESGAARFAKFSPNGRMVAFVRGNDLFIKKLDLGTEVAVTSDEKFFNGFGTAEYEAVFGATALFEWSADSRFLAFVRIDEQKVGDFDGMDFLSARPTARGKKFARSGEAIASASVRVYDTYYKTTKEMNLPEMAKSDGFYLPKIAWGETSEKLLVIRLSREQDRAEIVLLNGLSGVGRTVFAWEKKSAVSAEEISAFSVIDGGKMVVLRDGVLNLHNVETGRFLRRLTPETSTATAFYGFDEKRGLCYFQSAEDGGRRSVCVADSKGKLSRLSAAGGVNSAEFNQAKTWFLLWRSATICTASGKAVRELEMATVSASATNLPKREFFKFGAKNLNGFCVKPAEFSKNSYCPAVFLFGAEMTEPILDVWQNGLAEFLAGEGFVVVGFERKFADDLENLQTLISQVKTWDGVDENRLAVVGEKAGGFLALQALGADFGLKAGVAIKPIADFALASATETERVLRRPQENFSGYEKATLLENDNDFSGKLLLISSTKESEFFQQTMFLTDHLISQNIDFQMMIYPEESEKVPEEKRRNHLWQRVLNFLKDNF